MALNRRFLTAVALCTGLAIAPAAHADRWHDGHYNHHRGGGNAAGAAIIGGLVGLGVGAAIASGGRLWLLCAAAGVLRSTGLLRRTSAAVRLLRLWVLGRRRRLPGRKKPPGRHLRHWRQTPNLGMIR